MENCKNSQETNQHEADEMFGQEWRKEVSKLSKERLINLLQLTSIELEKEKQRNKSVLGKIEKPKTICHCCKGRIETDGYFMGNAMFCSLKCVEKRRLDGKTIYTEGRVMEKWEVLTDEQKERYDKELASDNWRKYSCDRTDYEI